MTSSFDSELPGVHVRTFGCQMNEYDSEKIIALLQKTHRAVSSPERAQVAVVNTCSVREKAQSKLYSYLGSLRALRSQNPELIIGVAGCVAQQEGEALLKKHLGVNFVVGTHNLSLIPSLVSRALSGAQPTAVVDYRDEWEELPEEVLGSSKAIVDQHTRPVRALVAIQRGCSKRCSFCVVPGTRGPQVSRAQEEVLREIELKVRLGAAEVLLLGQTVNSYGVDLQPRVRFSELIRRVSQISGLRRIRFTSPHPAEVRPDFIALYREIPELCPHIHLPLQSGSNRILKLMNRNYTRERFLEIAEKLAESCSNIAITTDLIVGFPTETEEDFEQTLEVMKQVHFSSAFSFKYSPRPNTVADAEYASSQLVPDDTASERLKRLQELQDQLSLEYNRAFVGKNCEVLVEGRDKKISSSRKGRTAQNIIVEVANCSAEAGQIVDVSILRASPHGMYGEAISRT